MNNQMKSIQLTETEVTLVDIALRKYWGRCKQLLDGDGPTGRPSAEESKQEHETLLHCNVVLKKLSSPTESLTDGYYEVIKGEIKPLDMGSRFNGRLHCDNYSLKAGLK